MIRAMSAKPSRPASIVVPAVVNLGFGAWAMIGALSIAVMPMMMKLIASFLSRMPSRAVNGADPMAPFNAMIAVYETPWVRAWMVVAAILQFLAGATLIASGIGLLQRREWGRLAALGGSGFYFVLGLAGVIVGLYINVLMADAMRAAGAPPTNPLASMFGMAIGLLFVVVVPGVNFLLLFRPDARAAVA
jgi:hypothetical protein